MTLPMSGDPGLAAFGSSLMAITLAELGDKTFFMALILSVRHPPRWVFVGAFAALGLVTLLSLGMGLGLREWLPQPVVPWLAAALFLGFGAKLLVEAAGLPADAAREEAHEAEVAIDAAESHGVVRGAGAVIWEAFVLVFLAELGDRTQFATIFLAAAPAFSFAGLLAGTLLGHALVTGLAVGAGQWIGGRISERVLYRLSGGLFVAFGVVAIRQAIG
ncbi:TMEM165/GDT1 family protein [Synechococcus sp. CCY 9618]|uniref:TMEM165/GDT1 family protein n=1 Tax=Synechococcus sp. CCY 9618 TaxID=2815602 RepID=UPI001C23F1E3|nr:TMEM165/GDT1 family protein [Synechococcus sp. CCY 9618]